MNYAAVVGFEKQWIVCEMEIAKRVGAAWQSNSARTDRAVIS